MSYRAFLVSFSWLILCGVFALSGLHCGVTPKAEIPRQEPAHCPTSESPQPKEQLEEPSTPEPLVDASQEPSVDKAPDAPPTTPEKPPTPEPAPEPTPEPTPEPAPEPTPELVKESLSNVLGPVHNQITHKVTVTRGAPYAQGMSYHPDDSTRFYPLNLTLDIYQPDDKHGQRRPVVVLLHGGGFWTGDSLMGSMVNAALYFAQRGWVCFSVNYRLRGNSAIGPKGWPANRPTYAAARDAKAAVRWIRANADKYRIHKDYIAAYGGSAGAYISVALGASDEKDYRDELLSNPAENKLLQNTHLTESSRVQAVISHWGAGLLLENLQKYDNRDRFDAKDAPLMILHGSADTVVPYSEATTLQSKYKGSVELYRLDGAGHSAWGSLHNGTPIIQKVRSFLHRKLNITPQP